LAGAGFFGVAEEAGRLMTGTVIPRGEEGLQFFDGREAAVGLGFGVGVEGHGNMKGTPSLSIRLHLSATG
jgi:hypothetical protein